MTEKDFTRKLMPAIRHHPELAEGAIFKLNDYYSAGIPDFCISLHGKTIWCEIKVEPNKPTNLQMYYLKRMLPSYVITHNFKTGYTEFASIEPIWSDVFNFNDLVEAIVCQAKGGR